MYMILLKRKNNGFDSRYKSYIEASFEQNSRQHVSTAKKKGKEYDEIIMMHPCDYKNDKQAKLGKQLFILLCHARCEPDEYMTQRFKTLKLIYKFIKDNQAWFDFWKALNTIENYLFSCSQPVKDQLSNEVWDMFKFYMNHPKWVIGLQNLNTPIIEKTVFYITPRALSLFENKEILGRKEKKELTVIKDQSIDLILYHTYSFGLYRQDILDLLPKNGIRYETINTLNLPRKLANLDKITNFINQERQYTMNPNGAVIDCYNCGNIDQIIMVEREQCLVWKVHFDINGYVLNSREKLIEDSIGMDFCGYFNYSFFPRSTVSEHGGYKKFEDKIYEFVLECYADIVCGSSKLTENFNRDVVNAGAMEMLPNIVGDEGKIKLRFTPRGTYNRIRNNTQTKEEFDNELKNRFVSGHPRKLTKNQSPSQKAIKHAVEFGIDLPQGYTFVRPYELGEDKLRSHYVKKIQKTI